MKTSMHYTKVTNEKKIKGRAVDLYIFDWNDATVVGRVKLGCWKVQLYNLNKGRETFVVTSTQTQAKIGN